MKLLVLFACSMALASTAMSTPSSASSGLLDFARVPDTGRPLDDASFGKCDTVKLNVCHVSWT